MIGREDKMVAVQKVLAPYGEPVWPWCCVHARCISGSLWLIRHLVFTSKLIWCLRPDAAED